MADLTSSPRFTAALGLVAVAGSALIISTMVNGVTGGSILLVGVAAGVIFAARVTTGSSVGTALYATGGFLVAGGPLIVAGGWLESTSPNDATMFGGYLMMAGLLAGAWGSRLVAQRSSERAD